MGLNEMDNGQYNLITGEAAYAHGAAMMVRREAIRKAGLMPENFFLYYEELDWCESINRAGYEIWVNMQAMIYHKESVSVGKNSAIKEYFMNRNRILFIRRNATVFQRWVFYLYFIFFVAPRNTLTYLKNGQSGFIKLLGKAIWWNFTNDVNSTYLGYPI
jgi:GT2 family glycosyltransferase